MEILKCVAGSSVNSRRFNEDLNETEDERGFNALHVNFLTGTTLFHGNVNV